MKRNFKINMKILLVFIALLSISTANSTGVGFNADMTITYQDFYDGLSPYGTWIEYPGYGHVWSPGVGGDFRPYLTNGYWDYTNEGWMWNSNYNWGWAPFHYGRWLNDNAYGWLWIPGYEWSPAWVTWGDYDDYYAWAPITPLVNVDVDFSSYRPGSIYWNVVGRNSIYDRNIYNRVLPRRDIVNNFNRITIINNFNRTPNHNHYYSRGPEVKDVERYTKHDIKSMAIQNVKRPDAVMRNENTTHVYRPIVQHEQPRTYRRMDTPMVRPYEAGLHEVARREAVSHEAPMSREPRVQEPSVNHAEQIQRVQALPEFRAPQNTFRSGERQQSTPSSSRRRN